MQDAAGVDVEEELSGELMTIYQLQTQESSAADVGIVIEGIPVLNNLAILAGPVAISWD